MSRSPQTTANRTEGGGQTWTLRHLNEEKTVGETELMTLAQKGLDYDRIREKYDATKPLTEQLNRLAEGSGLSAADYISELRTQAKRAGGMREDEARRAVALENRETQIAARERSAAAAELVREEQRREADLEAFRTRFPEAARDVAAIPASVWRTVRQGESLVTAYALHLAQEAREAETRARRRADTAALRFASAARSTGSMRSAGEGKKTANPFEAGFGG